MDEKQQRIKQVHDLIPPGWDHAPISIAHEIMTFLETVKDEGTSIDSGTDGVTGDLWVKIGGVEYYIAVKKSNAQLAKEGKT